MTTKTTRHMGAGALLLAAVLGTALWQGAPSADQTSRSSTARPGMVEELSADHRPPAGVRGATYYWLESQATRVTSRYDDGVVTVAERGADGALRSRVFDASGNERARLDVGDVIRLNAAGDPPFQTRVQPGVRPTLDWANRQLYHLWTEGTRNLVWRDTLMRAGTGVKLPASVETVWMNGLSARTERRANGRLRRTADRSQVASGEILTARLLKDGLQVGSGEWLAVPRVFQWSIPNMTSGYIDSARLSREGGWTFTPDAEWLNLQLIAFHHFKSLINQKGTLTASATSEGCPTSLVRRILNTISPTLLANEPGCDGLHWLDGTVLRYCCEMHDACYEKNGCSASSWWRWGSWSCNRCNASAVWCFVSHGCTDMLSCPYEQTP